jgi:hypothetical protein
MGKIGDYLMGLTFHYKLMLHSASIDEAKEKVAALHHLAAKLSFAQVDELVELYGEDCIFDQNNLDDPHIFLKLRALKPLDLTEQGFSAIDSTYFIGFDTLPGQGCESAAFGLATHTDLSRFNDWSWLGFCKTQYASNPNYGGLENFLNCHLRLVRMLDEAQKLGIFCDVTDEGQYWESRRLETLIQSLHEHNYAIASLSGTIHDIIADLGLGHSYAPIFDYPNFEYLEAEGNY